MASTSQTEFIHSTPVPRIYKIASKIAKAVKEGKDSLKNLVYAEKHVNIKTVYALVVEAFKRDDVIDGLIQKSQILDKEPRLNLWLGKILISELLWGKNKMIRGSKPIDIILSYEKVLRTLLGDCDDSIQPISKYKILKPRYVRVNTLKITTNEAVNNFKDEGWIFVPFLDKSDYEGFQNRLDTLKPDEFMKDIHIPDLLIFSPKTEFYQHPAYKSGSIILQDKASCLPVHLLAPPPGSIVLDTCAAPGMKTTQLAALLENEGTVYAVEVNQRRAILLKTLIDSASATCVKTIFKDVMQVTASDCPDVEYILVDPSCSGSGITDRVEIEKIDIPTKIERLRKLCNFQAKLLRHTMSAFPKAKRIVYSTCSMNSEENEDVVRQTLETSRQFKLVDAKKTLESWNTKTSDLYPDLGNMCIFASPEEDKTNGFFVAVFERLQEGEKNPYLNYELCKFFDKETKKNSNYDNIEVTNAFDMKRGKWNKNINSQANGRNYDDTIVSSSFSPTGQNKSTDREEIDGKEKMMNLKQMLNSQKLLDDNTGNIEVSSKNSNEEHCRSSDSPSKKRKKNRNSHEKINIASETHGSSPNVKLETLLENSDSLGNSVLHKEKKRKSEKLNNKEIKNSLDESVELGHTLIEKNKKHKKLLKKLSENTEASLENSTISEHNHNTSDKKKKRNKKSHEDGNVTNESFLDESAINESTTNGEKTAKRSLSENSFSNEDVKLETLLENSDSFGNSILHKEKKRKKEKLNNKEIENILDDSVELGHTLIEKNKKHKKLPKKLSENTEASVENSTISENNHNTSDKKKKRNKKSHEDGNVINESFLDESAINESTTNGEKTAKRSLSENSFSNEDVKLETLLEISDSFSNSVLPKEKKRKKEKLNNKGIENILDASVELGHTLIEKNKKHKKLLKELSKNTEASVENSTISENNHNTSDKKKKRNKKSHEDGNVINESFLDESAINESTTNGEKTAKRSLSENSFSNEDVKLETLLEISDSFSNSVLPKEKKRKKEKLNNKGIENILDASVEHGHTLIEKNKKHKKLLKDLSENTEAAVENSTISDHNTSDKKKKKNKKSHDDGNVTNNSFSDESAINESTNVEKTAKKSHKKNINSEILLNQNEMNITAKEGNATNELVFDESTTKGEKSKKKLHKKNSNLLLNQNEINITTELIENKEREKKNLAVNNEITSSYSAATIEPEGISKKNQRKKKNKDYNEKNMESENSHECLSIHQKEKIETEINNESDQRRISKMKKKKRSSTVDNDCEESKAKKIKAV